MLLLLRTRRASRELRVTLPELAVCAGSGAGEDSGEEEPFQAPSAGSLILSENRGLVTLPSLAANRTASERSALRLLIDEVRCHKGGPGKKETVTSWRECWAESGLNPRPEQSGFQHIQGG